MPTLTPRAPRPVGRILELVAVRLVALATGLVLAVGTAVPAAADDEPGTAVPSVEAPASAGPATDGPGSVQPSTTDPGTTDPGTTEPGTTEPGAEASSGGVSGTDASGAGTSSTEAAQVEPVAPAPSVAPGTADAPSAVEQPDPAVALAAAQAPAGGATPLVGALAAADASGTRTYTATDAAHREVTYTVPTAVAPGQDIVVSGTGWLTLDGSTPSVVSVMLDAVVSGDPNTVYTTRDVTNPLTGTVSADKRLHVIVRAAADGTWTATIPYPTAANSSAGSTSPTWSVGTSHAIRLLSGSLQTTPADVGRSLSASFTVADGQAYTSPADPTVTYYVPTTVEQGESIVVSGTGWKAPTGTTGSVVGVIFDARASGDPSTVYTTRDITNPLTGAVSADKRLQAIVQADANGSWTATIPYPTRDNARLSDGTWADWAAGSTHQVRLLTGSLAPGDTARSLTAELTIAGDAPPGPTEAPTWAHDTVTYADAATGRVATAWVQQDVAVGEGATVKLKGTGWVNQAGTGASTVAIKLNYGDGKQYTRTGAGIVEHPSASGDDTVWVLLAPTNPDHHPNVVAIDADGSFEIEIDAPAGLVAGQYLSVLLQSGRFDAADVLRTVTTGYLTVGGVPYVDAGGSQEVTCVPTSSTPTVTIENPQVTVGGLLHVTGTGWCHPTELRGGSVVGFKIDEGGYSHLTADVHQNKTIWAIVTADAADGTFDAEIQLPDGSTSGPDGSTPAFTEGSHTLRLLSGSLKTGDTVRSVKSGEFVVGAYRPNGAPDPVEATEGLTAATQGGVVVEQSSAAVTVTVPGAAAGDWVFLTAYEENGSPRYPWAGTWFQADAAGRVVADLTGVTLPVGTTKLAVQSGNPGGLGRLLGWGYLTVAAPVPTGAGETAVVPAPGAPSAAPSRPRVTVASATSPTPPSTVPDAPAATGDELTATNAGDVTGAQDGTVVTLTLPGTKPGDWVYLYAYSEPVPVGWVQVDAARQVRVDVALLPAGEHKIAVLDADGRLIGWAGATVAGAEKAVATDDPATTSDALAQDDGPVAAAGSGTPDSTEDSGLSPSDWWLIGGAALVVLVMIGGAAVVRRRRSADAPADGARRAA